MLQRYDARNADLRYWVNGTLRHRDEPGISPFDSVVQGGDAVWEGLLGHGVLVRETGPDGWLRVSIGTAAEMTAFRNALTSVTEKTEATP